MDYGLDYEGDMSGRGGGGGGGTGGGYSSGGARTPSAGGSSGYGGGGGGSGRKRASYDEQTIRAVTVSMMMQSRPEQLHDSTGLQLPDGRKLYHVQFVAAVRSFDDNSTHIMYQMEDGTGGVISVKQWLDDSVECTGVTQLRRACSKEHVYLKVVGQLKDYDGTKMVLADSIRPLSTANQITHHFLQVVYEGERFLRGEEQGRSSNTGFAGSLVRSDGPLLAANNGETILRDTIVRSFANNDLGTTITSVIQSLNKQFPEEAIRAEINYLSNEGILYSTIDEEHLGVA